MSDFLINNSFEPTNAGLNDQFKQQRSAGIPKSNFLVYAFLRDPATGLSDFAHPKLIGGCQQVSGLDANVEQKDSNDSASLIQTKVAGKISFNNISLIRGFDFDNFIRIWFNQRGGVNGVSDRFCLDLMIAKLTADGRTIARLIFVGNAWIPMYRPDDMDANSTDPWFENCELAHEGWVYGKMNGQAANDVTILLNADGLGLFHPSVWDYYWDGTQYIAYDELNFFKSDIP